MVTADPNVTDARYTFIKPYPPFKIGRGKELCADVLVLYVILKQQQPKKEHYYKADLCLHYILYQKIYFLF